MYNGKDKKMLLQNQSKRKFIIDEGILEPNATIDLVDERAEILSKEYDGELVILHVAQPKVVEKVVKKEEVDLEELTLEELKAMCDERGITYHPATKEMKLIKLLKGE